MESAQDIYNNICDYFNITNKPISIIDNTLSDQNLNGVYFYKKNEIRISSHLDTAQKIEKTIIHELAHHIIRQNGYRVSAHGWPFLTMEMFMAYKRNIDYCYVLNRNVNNWEPTAPLNIWWKHSEIALTLFTNIRSHEENLPDIDVLAKFIIEQCNLPLWMKYLSFHRHVHHTNTQGLVHFLWLIESIILIAALIIRSIGLKDTGMYFILFDLALFSLTGFVSAYRRNEFRPKTRLSRAIRNLIKSSLERLDFLGKC